MSSTRGKKKENKEKENKGSREWHYAIKAHEIDTMQKAKEAHKTDTRRRRVARPTLGKEDPRDQQ